MVNVINIDIQYINECDVILIIDIMRLLLVNYTSLKT